MLAPWQAKLAKIAAAKAKDEKNNPPAPTATEPLPDDSPKLNTGTSAKSALDALKNAKLDKVKPNSDGGFSAVVDSIVDEPKGKTPTAPENASTEVPAAVQTPKDTSTKGGKTCGRKFRDAKNAPKTCGMDSGHDGACTFKSEYTGETIVDASYVAPEPVPANAKPRKQKPVQAPTAVDTVVTRYPHQSKSGTVWTVSTVQDEDTADHILLTNKDDKTVPINPSFAVDAKQESQEIVMPDIDGGVLRVPCKTPKAARKLIADITAAVDQLTA